MIKVETGLRSRIEKDMLAACAVLFVLIVLSAIGRVPEPEPNTINISHIATR